MAGSADTRRAPRILCTGVGVLDEIFRVDAFPVRDSKVDATDYVATAGGCAANAAVAIARLGGAALYAGPLGGPAGAEPIGDRIVAALQQEGVDCSGCVRVDGVQSIVSGIFVDAQGGRTIATHRDPRLRAVQPPDPDGLVAGVDGVLADNRCPEFALPICRAACRRGLPVVLDADKPTTPSDPLFAAASHVVFSRSALCGTVGTDDLDAALRAIGAVVPGLLAVTDGPDPIRWRDGEAIRTMPTAGIAAVDTLAAGDVFHGAFALALLETGDEAAALRFAAAVAALKCLKFGGGRATPTRAEADRFIAAQAKPLAEK